MLVPYNNLKLLTPKCIKENFFGFVNHLRKYATTPLFTTHKEADNQDGTNEINSIRNSLGKTINNIGELKDIAEHRQRWIQLMSLNLVIFLTKRSAAVKPPSLNIYKWLKNNRT